jgi:hypothetical protein
MKATQMTDEQIIAILQEAQKGEKIINVISLSIFEREDCPTFEREIHKTI